MKHKRKIYDQAYKEKVEQLSYERYDISELVPDLGITLPQL